MGNVHKAADCSEVDVLIFAEDPGAANYLIPLCEDLFENGRTVKVLATGIARQCFKARAVPFVDLQVFHEAEIVLDQFQPKILVVGTAGNPDTFSLPLIAAAKKKQIISVGVIDAFMNAASRFSGRTHDCAAYLPDWVLVPDECVKSEFTSLGVQADRVVVCGHPHYDYVSEQREAFLVEGVESIRKRQVPKRQLGQKTLVFICEGSARVLANTACEFEEYVLCGRGIVKGRTEVVIEEFLDACIELEHRPYLILRLHPKDLAEDYSDYLHEFDQISQGGSALELVYASDIAVGATSMLLFEAAILGIPSLSIVPRECERQWLPSVRMGLTKCVTSKGQLQKELKAMLGQPSAISGVLFSLNNGTTALHVINDLINDIVERCR